MKPYNLVWTGCTYTQVGAGTRLRRRLWTADTPDAVVGEVVDGYATFSELGGSEIPGIAIRRLTEPLGWTILPHAV